MNQIKLHKRIDDLIKAGTGKVVLDEVKEIISANDDARNYFFNKADEKWLVWLWKNKFVDIIKEKGKDENQFSYTLPELQYLVNISENDPAGVVDIMLQVPISKESFNPEVVSRFLWICGSLPADQVARIVSKMRDEKWIQLMRKFTNFGFEYGKMLESFLTQEIGTISLFSPKRVLQFI